MCSDLRFTNVVAAFISELITKMKKFEEEGEGAVRRKERAVRRKESCRRMQGTDVMTKTQGKNETLQHVVSSVGENRLQGRDVKLQGHDVRLQVVILCHSCRQQHRQIGNWHVGR